MKENLQTIHEKKNDYVVSSFEDQFERSKRLFIFRK